MRVQDQIIGALQRSRDAHTDARAALTSLLHEKAAWLAERQVMTDRIGHLEGVVRRSEEQTLKVVEPDQIQELLDALEHLTAEITSLTAAAAQPIGRPPGTCVAGGHPANDHGASARGLVDDSTMMLSTGEPIEDFDPFAQVEGLVESLVEGLRGPHAAT